MRPVFCVAALALVASGCGATSGDGGTPSTPDELTVTLRPTGADGPTHSWTLRCDPPAGDHPDPAAACAALAELEAPFAPIPEGTACTEIYGGPATASVTGTYRGAAVDATFGRANGCEIDRWDKHAPIVDPEGSAAGAQ